MNTDTIIADVRRLLRDDVETTYRWTNEVLFKYMSDAEREIYGYRADLFLSGAGAITAPVDYTSPGVTRGKVVDNTTAVILDENQRQVFVNLIAARALAEDAGDAENLAKANEYRQSAFRLLGATG